METIGGLSGILFLLCVLGAVTAGAAFALHHLVDDMPKKKLLVTASLIGAFLPLSLPMVVILIESSFPETIIVLAAMVVIALAGALIVCFPVAWLVLGKLHQKTNSFERQADQ